MTKELLMVVEAVSNEKAIPRESIFEALEIAIASATRKRFDYEINVRVAIDRKQGDFITFRGWKIVSVVKKPTLEISFEAIQVLDMQGLQVGDLFEEEMESIQFDRIATQLAKQVIIQKIREAERRAIAEQFLSYQGKLLSGTVKETGREVLTLDLGNGVEAALSRSQMLPKEVFRVGDRVRAILTEIRWEGTGTQLQLSRVCPEMIVELLNIEVPEIGEGLIEIKAAVRDPGSRAKVAVFPKDQRIDPIGACVGMRGSRVQAISTELGGERVDVILWDEDPVQYVINAMAPTQVASIIMDEDAHRMDVAASEATLSQAIGRHGQNVRLASKLTGWTLNVLGSEAFDQQYTRASIEEREALIAALDIDPELAGCLLDEGFSTIETLAYLPEEEEASVTLVEAATLRQLRLRAQEVLHQKMQSQLEVLAQEFQQGLSMDLPSDLNWLQGLMALQIDSSEKLAEASIEELEGVQGLSPQACGALIMAARQRCWFDAKATEGPMGPKEN